VGCFPERINSKVSISEIVTFYDLIAAFQYLKGSYRKEGGRFFSRVSGDRTRRNGFKFKEGRFRFGIRKKYFTVRVVRYWNRMPYPWRLPRRG